MIAASNSLTLVLSTLIAYFLGGLPFGYWFIRLTSGKDIRTMGSGNIGATNVQRTAGMKAGLSVLVLDILKGFVAVWIALKLSNGDPAAMALSAFAVMLGHCYPLFLGFHGGKAVACFIGAFFYLAPVAFLVITILFLAAVTLSKHISLGSILGALAFPIAYRLIDNPPAPLLLSAVACALLIVFRHRANISRLRRGEESVFSFKRSRTA